MIAPAHITEWSQQCPWTSPAQVEQDLVLSRALVEIYSDPVLREQLLFRGGTALHKMVLQPAARWFSGEAVLPIYATTELLGTKLRALYQRRKGRDLFDLWQAHRSGVLDAPAVTATFAHYMKAEGHPVSAEEFATNLAAKMNHAGFLSDTPPLLRPGVDFDPVAAHDWITKEVLPLIP
jgi:predicted nucleotidyltransferase component of viral defense system